MEIQRTIKLNTNEFLALLMTDSVVIERQSGEHGIIGDVRLVADEFGDDEYYGAPFDAAIVDVQRHGDRWLYTLRAVRA